MESDQVDRGLLRLRKSQYVSEKDVYLFQTETYSPSSVYRATGPSNAAAFGEVERTKEHNPFRRGESSVGEPPHLSWSIISPVYAVSRPAVPSLMADNVAVDSLVGDTETLLNNARGADICFVVEGKTVHAHRRIVSARSDYFRKLVESEPDTPTTLEIPIPDLTHAVFLGVMEYLYTKHANLGTGEHAVEVLKAAHAFEMDGLKALCAVTVKQAVNVGNVVMVCKLAQAMRMETLKQFCFSFMIQNLATVFASPGFVKLVRDDDGLMKEILLFVDSIGRRPSLARKRGLT